MQILAYNRIYILRLFYYNRDFGCHGYSYPFPTSRFIPQTPGLSYITVSPLRVKPDAPINMSMSIYYSPENKLQITCRIKIHLAHVNEALVRN